MLLALGAVIVGVALSLLLGSSPAHAAESDDPGSGDGLLGGVSSLVDQTLEQTTSAVSPVVTPVVAPLVQHVDRALPAPISTAPVASTVDRLTGAVASASPTLQPVLTPVLHPVTSILDTTLQSVDRLIGATPVASTPAAETPATTTAVPSHPLRTPVSVVHAATAAVAAPIEGAGIALATIVPAPATDSTTVPAASITASPITLLGMLGSMTALVAVALLSRRRRPTDDALPASPVFETDTSPA